MIIKTLTSGLSVMPQITEADIATLAARGFKSIIVNRPEDEGDDQPRAEALAAAANRQGMETRYIPVVSSKISADDVAAFKAALQELSAPIAAFCRTGTRSTILWALANNEALSADERIRIAAAQGYDLEPFRSRIEAATGLGA